MTDITRNAAGGAVATLGTEDRKACASDDIELLERVRAGDEAASTAFVRKHAGHMLAVARRFFRCHEDSADAVQDAFLAAFRALDQFEGRSSPGTWLHRIVIHACLAKLRVRSRSRAVSLDGLLPAFDEEGRHARPAQPWPEQPLSRLTREEVRIRVRACIDRLPEPYRVVLLLRDIEEFGTEETAQQLGITSAAVKTRLHRARQALRTLVEPIFL